MKITYSSPEAEAAAKRDELAANWALTNRAEYDAMLAEAFPDSLPRIPGEWRRRMDVLVGTASLLGSPEHRNQEEAAAA